MKKKFICLVMGIVLLSLLLVACNGDPAEETGEGEGVLPANEESIYETLNKFLNSVGPSYDILTKTTKGEDIFVGSFSVSEASSIYRVAYSYEMLSDFEIVDGKIIAPKDYKTTVSGYVMIKDNVVLEQNGAKLNLSAEAFNVSGIVLSEENLTEVNIGAGTLNAKISSLKAVTGIDDSAENATINITYTEEKIISLTLSYSTSSCQTEIKYIFS